MSSRGAPLERRARGNCPRWPPLNPALATKIPCTCENPVLTHNSWYTRDGNIKAKLKTTKNGSPSLHLMISSNTALLIINRWAVSQHSTSNPTAKIYLPWILKQNSMHATTYIWTANCQKQNAYVGVLILYVGMFLFWIHGCWRVNDCKHCNAQLFPDCEC